MKGIIGLVVLLGIGIAAYFLMNGPANGPDATPVVENTTAEPAETTDEAPVEEPKEETADTVEGAVDALKEEAEAAVEEAKEELQEIADEAEEKVNDAVNELKDEAKAILEGATDTGGQASEATEGAIEGTTNRIQGALEDALGGAADASTEGGEITDAEAKANLEHDAPAGDSMGSLSQALSEDGFDGLAIREAIQNSDMNDLQKAALEALVTKAEENPDQIQTVVEKLREALGG